MNLCQMDIDFLLSANTGNATAVNDGQIQLCCKQAVNTTLSSACIDQGVYVFYPRSGNR